MYAAFAKRDFDAFRSLCTDDLTWTQNPGFPNGQTYKGADAVIAGVFQANDVRWEAFRFQIDSMDCVPGRVFVIGKYTGKSRLTHQPFEAAVTHVYDLVEGRISRFRMFADTHTLHQYL